MRQIAFLALLILLSSCERKESKIPRTVATNIAGAWAGVVNTEDHTPIMLEFYIVHEHGSVKGFGTAQTSRTNVKAVYKVFGICTSEKVQLTFSDVMIFFDGQASGVLLEGDISGAIRKGKVSFIKRLF